MEFDKICHNCGSFFQDDDDFVTYFGVCLRDNTFEPFLDEIIEDSDFSCCRELYEQKRFNGDREPCEHYEEPEILDIPDGMGINTYLYIEGMKHQDMVELVEYLYNPDNEIVNRAISTFTTFILFENENAYKELLRYYMGLGPAENLEDVHTRMNIIRALHPTESEKETIDAYINELARTPSNNTTGKLYRGILERLRKHPLEAVQEPLLELLEKKKFSYKMKNKILEVATDREVDAWWRE